MKLNITIEQVQEIVKPIVDKLNLTIYEINFVKDYSNNVVQILLENNNDDPTVSFDNLIKANELISAELDKIDKSEDAYILEVASAGLERKIKTDEYLKKQVGEYVNVISVDNLINDNATLIKVDGDNFVFEYLPKGVKKTFTLAWEEIKEIRFAVKF